MTKRKARQMELVAKSAAKGKADYAKTQKTTHI